MEAPETGTGNGGDGQEKALIPFLPENVNQAWRMSTMLAKSQLVPRSLQGKPTDIVVILITGRELGLSPMQALRGMHVIEGKVVIAADLMSALVIQHRELCEYFRLVDSNENSATYETKRSGHPSPVKMSFTINEATRAGLTAKDNWKKYPAAMLRARCSSALCRAVYPDLVSGVYDPDEAVDLAKARGLDIHQDGTVVDMQTGEVLAPEEPDPLVKLAYDLGDKLHMTRGQIEFEIRKSQDLAALIEAWETAVANLDAFDDVTPDDEAAAEAAPKPAVVAAPAKQTRAAKPKPAPAPVPEPEPSLNNPPPAADVPSLDF